MIKQTDPPLLVLASKSPRRKDLLRQVGLSFDVVPSRVDEHTVSAPSPEAHVRLLAEAKAAEVAARYPRRWVLGADTEVIVDDASLGKPRTAAEARSMLRSLSGRVHRVLTGFCLCRQDPARAFSETVETRVEFRVLTEDDIAWYIKTAEPFDKAGGYAVQGLGAVFIKRIEGSYPNVVGLPVCELMAHLIREGVVKR